MEKGLVQRVTALNRFLHDVYHDQEILQAGIVPVEQVLNNAQFRKEMMGVYTPHHVYSHIAGVDIVRAPNAKGEGEYYVLEDNLRVPSGVSYMLEDRKMMMRLFPDLFSQHRVAPVAHYPDLLLETLRASAQPGAPDPTVVVLTPGMYNSAYFEHAFLAQQMGVELVEGQDLFVKDASSTCAPRAARSGSTSSTGASTTTSSTPRCSARIPRWAPRAWSRLPGRQRRDLQRHRHRRGRRQVDLPLRAEDDRVLPGREADPEERAHLHVPQPDDLKYVLANLKKLVVKEVHGAGGYGMLVGPAASKQEIEDFRAPLIANPGGYIAQPTLSLSSCPTFVESGIAPRHIDLRPFVLSASRCRWCRAASRAWR
jgi:uncharacterized circularly permuted ATP-grasp superfamily protein